MYFWESMAIYKPPDWTISVSEIHFHFPFQFFQIPMQCLFREISPFPPTYMQVDGDSLKSCHADHGNRKERSSRKWAFFSRLKKKWHWQAKYILQSLLKYFEPSGLCSLYGGGQCSLWVFHDLGYLEVILFPQSSISVLSSVPPAWWTEQWRLPFHGL